MKTRFIITMFLLATTMWSAAQLLTSDPEVPLANQEATIFFNASLGNGDLEGYTGDVYAHTGVITENSTSGSDWKYVKTEWGQNTPETRMTRTGQNLYMITIGPSVREYYEVPENETILQMAFVFRSAEAVGSSYLEGKTASGGDIFLDVLEPGSITFIQPENRPSILELNDDLVVEALAFEADSTALFENNVLIKKDEGNHIIDTLTATDYGKTWVKAMAWNGMETIVDSFYYYVRQEPTILPLPGGIRDGINYIDEHTVVLSLFAPNKEYVFAIGDFNDWELDDAFSMNKTPDSSRYWVEIDNLVPGKEYIFQYFIDGEIRVGDPYADKTSDPGHDKYISEATYPGMISYPEGKTSGVATVLQTDQVDYQWQVTSFTPVKVTDLVIYEILIRDFTSDHTYKAVADTLDYLQRLGVNAVELMPVNEFEGNVGWGYNPSYYFAPDKYYGPKDELKRLVDECHQRGMAVIIDMVLNHAKGQCPQVMMYFDGSNPTSDSPWFNVQSNFVANGDVQSWGPDFNHESIYTQQLVDSISNYWMSEYMIDGFRFDFTKGIGNNIKGDDDYWGSKYDADRIRLLKRMADAIWDRNPDAFVILEHLSENIEEKELADYGMLMWGNMSYNYAEAAMGYHEDGKSDFSWISYQNRGWDEARLVGYMESHDEERLMYKCITWGAGSGDYQVTDTTTALDRMQLDAMFYLTIPGPKMIWQFGELGYDYSIDFNGRLGEKPVRWDYYDDYRRRYLYDFYRTLAKLRVEQAAFETDDFALAVTSRNKRITLRHESMDVVIIGNFGVEESNMIPGFTHTGTWYDYFSGQAVDVASITDPTTLQAGEYHLYTDVQLPFPDIGTGIGDDETGNPVSRVRIYPNPSDGQLSIIFEGSANQSIDISLYDVIGKKMGTLFTGVAIQGANTISVNLRNACPQLIPGLYYLHVDVGSYVEVHKVMVQ